MEASTGCEPSELVRGEDQVYDGNERIGAGSGASRGLDGDPGPSRCIFPYSHSSEIQEVPKVHSGGEECQSGPAEHGRATTSDGVDAASRGMPESEETVGPFSSGPFSDCNDEEIASLLLSSPRPSSSRGGCLPVRVDGSGCLRLSSVQDSRKGHEKVQLELRDKTHSHSSLLAGPKLVHRSTGMDSGHTKNTARRSRFTQTTSLRQVSQEHPCSGSDCVQTIERLVRARGFSREAAKAVARARKSSTIKVYQSKWETFRKWCKKQKVSSSSTSVTQIADFLLYLKKEVGLSNQTVKGYRSMLAAVFRHRGLDISNNLDLRDLLRSFETKKERQCRAPSWNLDIVLKFLGTNKFEPLRSASLRDISKKTIFLVALATAKRISELQAINKEIGWKHNKAVCTFQEDFLAKNENPSNPWPRFEIMSLSDLVGQEQEVVLCPVRAMRHYVERTKGIRETSGSLWCSVKEPSRPMTKNAIAFFLRELIKEAHMLCQEENFGLLKVKAHEVRAVATSLAFKKNMALKDIIETTFWRTNSVFASHYLRDVKTTFDNCQTLGPYVSSGAVLGKGVSTP
ncbi:uncharacterized protein LOC135221257 [Macrobrachium nipponense]|uniref:uncharacterized protein LOC135221257 n=1 Tax=Macrobrachium nipponense TaxID=159736 RepID=UPI0030C80F17